MSCGENELSASVHKKKKKHNELICVNNILFKFFCLHNMVWGATVDPSSGFVSIFISKHAPISL